jgi:tetratricopeptide (TPR) repeat protein
MSAPSPAVTEARGLLQAGRAAEAEALLRRHLHGAPNDPAALRELALMARQAGQREAARALLEHAVRVGGTPELWADLATLRQEAGAFEPAVTAYRKALDLKPGWHAPRANLAAALLKLTRYEEALDALEPLLAERPWHPYALAYKALALWELGRDAESLALSGIEDLVSRARMPTLELQPLIAEIRAHPTLTGSADPTRRAVREGKVTADLFQPPVPPALAALRQALNALLAQWIPALPQRPHPWLMARPSHWRLIAWGNVLTGAGHQAPHIHNLGWLSGVLYLKVPSEIRADDPEQGGWIEFGRPGYGLPVLREPKLRTMAPVEGALLLFPSALWHATKPFTGEGERISLAFDLAPA